LQHTASHCNTRQHTCNTLQHTATHGNTLQRAAAHRNTLQITATHGNTSATQKISRQYHFQSLLPRHTCNTSQHTAAHSRTLRHTCTNLAKLVFNHGYFEAMVASQHVLQVCCDVMHWIVMRYSVLQCDAASISVLHKPRQTHFIHYSFEAMVVS